VEADHSGYGLDTGFHREALSFLNVNVSKNNVRALKRDLLDLGLQLLAGHAPGCSELDHHMGVAINELSNVVFVTGDHVCPVLR
jgi:hypothetical protein